MPPPCTGRGLNQEVASATNTANGSKVPAAHQHSKQQFQRSSTCSPQRLPDLSSGERGPSYVSSNMAMARRGDRGSQRAARHAGTSSEWVFHVGINI